MEEGLVKLEVKGRDDAKWKLERGVRGIYTVVGLWIPALK